MLGRLAVDGREVRPGAHRRLALRLLRSKPAPTAARAAAFQGHLDSRLDGAYRLAAVILGDRIEAEDVVHDAALAAWQGYGRLRDDAAFDAWFTRIIVNGCRDRLRRRARRRVRDLGRGIHESEHPLGGDASEEVARRESLAAALARLDSDTQVLVALRYARDLTVPSIAGLLGVPEGTVKSRLHHALRELRAAMEDAER